MASLARWCANPRAIPTSAPSSSMPPPPRRCGVRPPRRPNARALRSPLRESAPEYEHEARVAARGRRSRCAKGRRREGGVDETRRSSRRAAEGGPGAPGVGVSAMVRGSQGVFRRHVRVQERHHGHRVARHVLRACGTTSTPSSCSSKAWKRRGWPTAPARECSLAYGYGDAPRAVERHRFMAHVAERTTDEVVHWQSTDGFPCGVVAGFWPHEDDATMTHVRVEAYCHLPFDLAKEHGAMSLGLDIERKLARGGGVRVPGGRHGAGDGGGDHRRRGWVQGGRARGRLGRSQRGSG